MPLAHCVALGKSHNRSVFSIMLILPDLPHGFKFPLIHSPFWPVRSPVDFSEASRAIEANVHKGCLLKVKVVH